MTGLLFVVRSVHLGSLTLLVGAVSFLVLVARPAWRSAGPGPQPSPPGLDRLFRVAAGSLIATVISALGWLGLQAALASGLPPAQALGVDTIGPLLTGTHFGRVWILRLALMALLGGFLLFRDREQDSADWIALRVELLLLAMAVAASLAWAGHAAAIEGGLRVPALVADAVHLVATGVWLGGLLSLFMFLGGVRRDYSAGLPPATGMELAGVATRRFSALALVAVGTLTVTGLVNAWAQVGGVPRLVGTWYGRLLLLKLALFVAIVGIAAVNRRRLVPRLDVGSRSRREQEAALGRLRRNVLAELFLGGAVLAIAGALAVTPPARHLQPAWPFGVRLSWQATGASPQVRLWLAAGALVAVVGLAVLGFACVQRVRWRWAGPLGVGIVVYGGWLALSSIAIDAYPTTYLRPTVAYQAASIARGADLYRQHCAGCHGVAGYGDGPAGRRLAKDPADLTAKHAADHTAGDFFWWVSHGMPRGPMPGFARELDEAQRWDVINFVRVLAAAEAARFLTSAVTASPAVVAPDFAFGVGVGPTETLRDHRGWAIVHLVLFTVPASLPRLTQLDAAWSRIGLAGARVIAVPMREPDRVYRALGLRALNFPIAVEGSREITETYALFRESDPSGPAGPAGPAGLAVPGHVEFLIDRQGYARARWQPGVEPGWADIGGLLEQIGLLDKEAPRAPAPEEHVH